MRKTKIDWADSTWNPVTGCLHGCEYCYARRIAARFKGGGYGIEAGLFIAKYKDDVFKPPYVLEVSQLAKDKSGWYRDAHYPFGFEPTFHRYRLGEPAQWKKPSTIFVCSMADLFGDWVPDEWIEDVFKACQQAPHHTYLFLTKNPKRYITLAKQKKLPMGEGFWYGSTITTPEDMYFFHEDRRIKTFLSIEPILAPFDRRNVSPQYMPSWAVVGAETGNGKGKIIPQKSWIDEISAAYKENGKPVFMKDSLRELMGADFVQEYPWEMKGKSR